MARLLPSSLPVRFPGILQSNQFFPRASRFSPGKKKCSRLLHRTVIARRYITIYPGKRRGSSFVLRNTRPDAGASRPPSLPPSLNIARDTLVYWHTTLCCLDDLLLLSLYTSYRTRSSSWPIANDLDLNSRETRGRAPTPPPLLAF